MKLSHNRIQELIKTKCNWDKDREAYYIEQITMKVYKGSGKLVTRILNNTSQPSLVEAAHIADILDVTIDELVVFERQYYPVG
jgi:transcriptional regulator with XRE-family HTH domain